MRIDWKEAVALFVALVLAIWIGVGLWNKSVGAALPAAAV